MSRKFTEQEQARLCKKALAALRKTGSLRRAGEAAGVSHEMVRRWAAAAGIAPNPRGGLVGRPMRLELKRAATGRVAAGESTALVADEIGVHIRTLRCWCRSAGVTVTKAKYRQNIGELRKLGMTIDAIAKRLGLAYRTVWKNLRALGMTGPRGRRHG